MDRTILHCDCNGFFAAVECILRPELRDVPMAVGGDPANRHGIILAKNELAKKFGVRTPEPIWQAKQKCPGLVIVTPHHEKYSEFSNKVNEIYERFTDLVEPFGIDESWLDITGSMHLFGGSGKEVADLIRETVKRELELTISVGVSFNKIFAKLGSDYKKPDATTVIARENYKDIVFPLPVENLLYVGRTSKLFLERLGIQTIGQLAAMNRDVLSRQLGKAGDTLWLYANGLDDSEVKPANDIQNMKSVGNGLTYRRDLCGKDDISIAVACLCDSVASRMRRYGVKANTLHVQIKDPDFKTVSKQRTLSAPTYLSGDLCTLALQLIEEFWDMRQSIRAITVTASQLVQAGEVAQQLSFFDIEKHVQQEKLEQLERTVDAIKGKFGKGAISRATVISNDLGLHKSE